MTVSLQIHKSVLFFGKEIVDFEMFNMEYVIGEE